MILSSLILITALAITQPLQASYNFINSITNKSNVTFELLRGPTEKICTKSFPPRCYEQYQEIIQIKPGDTKVFEKITSNIPFTIAPKEPLEFITMKVVTPEFIKDITEKNFTCMIKENALQYSTGIPPTTSSILFGEKTNNITINTDYSISIR